MLLSYWSGTALANPNKPRMHKFKGRTGDGQAVAKCGRRVPSHVIVTANSDVTCVVCLRKL